VSKKSTTVAMYEGRVLAQVESGRKHAIEHAECVIDGAMNALVRLQGAEVTAHFAFALSDRVAAGLRQPTEAIFPAPDDDEKPPEAPAAAKPRQSVIGLMLQIIGAYAVLYQITMWLLGSR
jgi:hypothetical protein